MAVDKMTSQSGRELCNVILTEINKLSDLDNKKIQGLMFYRILMARKCKLSNQEYNFLLTVASTRNILDYLIDISEADDILFATERKLSIKMRIALKSAFKDSE